MPQRSLVSVARYVHKLAKDHEITDYRDGISRMAELDDVEQLMVNLKRKGVLTKSEILSLQGRYFLEQRNARKKLTT